MEEFVKLAYKEAIKALNKEEIPVGAVVIKNNKVIAKAHNNRQKSCTVLGHAEINAILKAEKSLKDWRLDGTYMIVTLEPCPLCQKVIEEARLDNVYYLVASPTSEKNNDKIVELPGFMEEKKVCREMIDTFFSKLRV